MGGTDYNISIIAKCSVEQHGLGGSYSYTNIYVYIHTHSWHSIVHTVLQFVFSPHRETVNLV